MMLLLLHVVQLTAAAAAAGDGGETRSGEASTTSPIAVFSTTTTVIDTAAAANQTLLSAAMMMPEAKRVADGPTMWSPSADLTPMMMHHQLAMPPAAPQPQAVYPAVAHSPQQQQQQPHPQQQQQQQQHLMQPTASYHDDEFPSSQYGPPSLIGSSPPSSNEYPRSELHYGSYPPFEQPSYPLLQQQTPPPQQQQQQLDTSLIPTAKHFVLVSFIGLLLLFAIIQNSISAAKRKDALVEVLSNRKKRDIIALTNYKMTPELKSALKEDERVRCIQRTLCYENRKLHQDLGGIFGNLLGKYLTHNVQSSLQQYSPGWDRLVQDAADAGSRGDDCDVLYRDCSSSSQFRDPTEIQVEE